MSVPEPDAATAVVQRILPAPPDVVYREWIDPDALADWMCPRPARATKIELDARIGGRLQIDIDDGATQFVVSGRYIDLDPPNRLGFTWSCSTWPDPQLESVVAVTLEPHGRAQTLMTIHHTLLPPGSIADHQEGWTQVAEQLDDALPGRA